MAKYVVTIRHRVSRRQQLPEEVASYVRELINSGAVQPGEFLRMERIAELDARRARSLMEQHILASADYLIDILEERGLWGSKRPDGQESVS
jgi:DNA-binding GntR family transcriptional regulator